MKNKKLLLWIALLVMAIIPIYAQQYDSEKDFQIDWDTKVEGGVIITRYIGSKKEVRIPPSIQNNPVTGIRESAFWHNSNITRVIIPNSVTSIGNRAFSNCESLTSVTIGNGVTSIGNGAFYSCKSLTSVTIGNSVTSIGDEAFSNCGSLTNITIPNGVTSIGNMVFSNCTGLTGIIIPDSVTSMGGGAFSYCNKLTSVIIGKGITSLNLFITWNGHYGSFQNCTSLTSVTIGNGVTIIGDNAFFNCTNLTNVIIPDSVTSIWSEAFASSGLTSITIPDSVTSVGSSAFKCGLTSVTFQGTIAQRGYWSSEGISSEAFPGDLGEKYYAADGGPGTYTRFPGGEVWKKTQSVSQPAASQQTTTQTASATSSQGTTQKLVAGTSGLWYELIETNNEKYYAVVKGTVGIGDVVIPASYNNLPVRLIDNSAFSGRSDLTSITIPDSVTSIGSSAFSGCNNLNITWYYNPALTNHNFRNYLKNVIISASVTSIENSAFAYCTNLTSVTIPASVTSIGDYAFASSGLTGVTIPANVTSIGDSAFAYCTSLTSVTFQGNIDSDKFNNKAFNELGDLRAKYLKGGIGTYTRPKGKTTWTRQKG